MTVARFETGAAAARLSGLPHFQMYPGAGGESVCWRLLSGNNRDLGRGLVGHDTIDECRRAILDMVTELPDLQGLLRPAGEHRWVWALRSGQRVVAVSAHQYDRQVRCEAARQQFMRYAAIAAIDPDLMRTRTRRTIGIVAKCW